MHAADARFKVISFSRNFGHQTAVFAGLSHALGDFVGVMDADLQDPPEFLLTCLEKLKEGYDVVYAVRRQRKENWFKTICYSLFYRLRNASPKWKSRWTPAMLPDAAAGGRGVAADARAQHIRPRPAGLERFSPDRD